MTSEVGDSRDALAPDKDPISSMGHSGDPSRPEKTQTRRASLNMKVQLMVRHLFTEITETQPQKPALFTGLNLKPIFNVFFILRDVGSLLLWKRITTFPAVIKLGVL